MLAVQIVFDVLDYITDEEGQNIAMNEVDVLGGMLYYKRIQRGRNVGRALF